MTTAHTARRVTVLMATYNGAAYIGEAVEGILGQTFGDLELVVVDDGSTDGSADVVRAYRDPRIRVVENGRNLGLAESLNRGLALARGELVARHDSDDLSSPERLARQVAHLDANADVALVGSWYREIDAAGTVLAVRRLPVEYHDILWALNFYSPFVHSAVLWRRAPVRDAVGGYDERLAYSMDYDLWCRIASRFRVANLPDPLLDLRVHDDSMTATYGARADEGRRMRAARVARMLGRADGGVRGEELADAATARFERLYTLLHGAVTTRTAGELREDVGELRRLHAVFCAERSLDARSVERQRRRMARMLRQRLTAAARLSAAAGHPGDALAQLAYASLAPLLVRPGARLTPAELPVRG